MRRPTAAAVLALPLLFAAAAAAAADAAACATMRYYVSVTGLDLNAWYHAPKFWWYTLPAMAAAKAAPGCVSAEGNNIRGTHHTMSVWENREAMLRFMRGAAHREAMAILDSVATGKVFGYETDVVPSWEEARRRYDEEGRLVGRAGREARAREREAAGEGSE